MKSSKIFKNKREFGMKIVARYTWTFCTHKPPPPKKKKKNNKKKQTKKQAG